MIHLLSLKVEPRKYNLGESIISRGEIGREMFFIVSGVVEVLSDDNLKVLARFHEGQFFGEIAVLLDVPRIANVRAVSEVEVFVLTKENLEAVFHAVPGAADTITNEGHRLYQNWLQTFTLQGEDQIMDDGEARSSFDADSQSSGVVVPQGTDQESTGLSSGSIHPIEAGHPAGKHQWRYICFFTQPRPPPSPPLSVPWSVTLLGRLYRCRGGEKSNVLTTFLLFMFTVDSH